MYMFQVARCGLNQQQIVMVEKRWYRMSRNVGTERQSIQVLAICILCLSKTAVIFMTFLLFQYRQKWLVSLPASGREQLYMEGK